MPIRTGGARRTHAMLRSFGQSEPNQFPVEAFRGGCCKLFFPLTETVGATTITDTIGGAVFTPATMDFSVAHAINVATPAGAPLTYGSLPVIGTSDFIWMHVYTGAGFGIRPQAELTLLDASGEYIARLFDGDGVGLFNSDGSTRAATETLAGASSPDIATYTGPSCHAIVRNGSSLGDWLHNDSWNVSGALPCDFVDKGEIFCRVIRNNGYTTSPITSNYGEWARNDYSLPDYVIRSWQPQSNGYVAPGYIRQLTTVGHWGDVGLPGVWPHVDPAYSVRSAAQLRIGNGIINTVMYDYGIALFVFRDGLPADFKDALRWMRDQWAAGNKTIWPDWISVV